MSLLHPSSRGEVSSVPVNALAHSSCLTLRTGASRPRTLPHRATPGGWLAPQPSHALYI